MNYFSNFLVKSASSLLVLVLLFSISNAQTGAVKVNPKVIEAFGNERVSSIQLNSPDSITFYNFLVENSYKVIKKEYLSSNIIYSSLEEIKVKNSWIVNGNVDFLKFNVLQISVKPDQTKNMYYRISGTDNVLLLKSTEYNRKKFEGYKSFQK